MTEPPQTLLAFDFGKRRIGVAVGQTLTETASPLETVPVKRSAPDWDAISRLIQTWQPDALVVGNPLNMDGSEQTLTRDARRFGNQLRGRFNLPVHAADERLSTVEARSRMAEQGRLGREDDPVAAQIILETWFSSRPSPGDGGPR